MFTRLSESLYYHTKIKITGISDFKTSLYQRFLENKKMWFCRDHLMIFKLSRTQNCLLLPHLTAYNGYKSAFQLDPYQHASVDDVINHSFESRYCSLIFVNPRK